MTINFPVEMPSPIVMSEYRSNAGTVAAKASARDNVIDLTEYATPDDVSREEQARYNYRMLQALVADYGYRGEVVAGRTLTLWSPVDARGLLVDDDVAPYMAEIELEGDRHGWIVSSMQCVGFDAPAGEWFNRAGMSIQAPMTNMMLGSWQYMSAPLRMCA